MYSIISQGTISQAAAGLGQTMRPSYKTRAYKDGVFGRAVGATAIEMPVTTRLRSYRDGVFGRAVGAITVLDLADPSVMKEVKAALGITMDPTVSEEWLKSPVWDEKAEALYMKLVNAFQGPAEAKAGLVAMQAGHATPTVLGIIGLYQTVLGNPASTPDKVAAALPILADFVETNKAGGGKVLPPKIGSLEAGMFSTKTLVGIGVGVAVVGIGWLILKKK